MRICLLLLSLLSLASAESRTWKNADGSRSFPAEFVRQDGNNVILTGADGKQVSVALANLHADDRAWIANHGTHTKLAAYDEKAVFDTLHFGDNRSVVEKKLRSSKMVELTVDETFLGRFGLNGSFRTRRKIGDLACTLSFAWDNDGGMKELSLQTENQASSEFAGPLQSTWTELAKLMTLLHGQPVSAGTYPPVSRLQDGMFLPTHMWKLKSGGSAVLGAAREGALYQVVVRLKNSATQAVELK